jgi:hypothetical protein
MKGFLDERRFYTTLTLLYGIDDDDIETNDLSSYSNWCSERAKGADFKIEINGKILETEKKYLKAKCYRSWVWRDYIPRFSFNEGTIPVVVVTNKWNITYNGRKLLKEYRIKMLSDHEFGSYLLRSMRRKGNKYTWMNIYINCVLPVLSMDILRKCLFEMLIIPRFKLKLSALLSRFKQKVSECARFLEKISGEVRSGMIMVLKCKMLSNNGRDWKVVDVYYAKKKNEHDGNFRWMEQDIFEGLKLKTTKHPEEKRIEEGREWQTCSTEDIGTDFQKK